MANGDELTGGFQFSSAASGTVENPADPDALSGSGDSNSGGPGNDFTFDAERHIAADKRNADGSFRRKRARRNSGGNSSGPRKTEKVSQYSVSAVEGVLLNIHGILAAVTKTPEIALNKTEASALANALVDVQKLYPHTVFSPKVAAWTNLGLVAVVAYGPRLYMIRERIRMERVNARNAAKDNGDLIDMTAFNFTGQQQPKPGVQ